MRTCPSCGIENPTGFLFCGRCGSPLAEAAPERRKTVTVLFCDVTGSTALGERLETEAVREVMLRYFDEMRVAIEHHSGTVEKFIGDAVVAVFGVPVAHEDDALRAVRAATEMLGRLEALNDEFDSRFGSRIGLRIGINTGEVVAGDPGAAEAFVSGDTVNVAARLEQTARAGEVLLGDLTYRLVREAVTAEAVEGLALKGKEKPVPAYRLVNVAADGGPARGGAASVLVGRRERLGRAAAVRGACGRPAPDRRNRRPAGGRAGAARARGAARRACACRVAGYRSRASGGARGAAALARIGPAPRAAAGGRRDAL